MDRNDFVEFRQRIVFHGNHRTIMPRIVYKDIDPAELFAARGDDMSAGSLQHQVGRCVRHAPAPAGNLRRCRAELLLRARGKKYSSAFSSKNLADGPAYSSARAD